MSGTTYGYVRVSSRDQNEERQVLAMRDAGVESGCIVIDKQSGKDLDRPGLQKLYQLMQSGDTLIIKSIDRLGRNYDDILKVWRDLTERGIGIVVLDMPLLNTAKDRDLTGRLIADIVLQLLSYVAETERNFIRQRQTEGIAAAKARGVKFGREPIERPPEWETLCRKVEAGEMSVRGAAMRLGVSHTTVCRWARELRKEGDQFANKKLYYKNSGRADCRRNPGPAG